MNPFLKKLFIFQRLTLLLLLLSFTIFPLVKLQAADLSSYVCAAEIVFDVNPKTGPSDSKFNLTGTVTAKQLVPTGFGISQNDVGYCGVPGSGSPATKFYVSIYDKNTSKKLIPDIVLTLPGYKTSGFASGNGINLWNFPDFYFTPTQSFTSVNVPTALQVAALVKVTDGSNWVNLTESAPVNIQLTKASAENACSTVDSSDCSEGFYCDQGSKTCKASSEGTDCSQDATICAAPLTCTNNHCTKPPGAGSKVNDASCNTSSECKSNLCTGNDTDGWKCQACTGPADCNTDTDNGYACNAGVCVKSAGSVTPPSVVVPLWDCKANFDTTHCIYNPLQADFLAGILLYFMKGFLGLIGLVTVAFIIVGGYKLTISAGNEELTTSAKKTITWAVIGFLLALMAFSIIAILQNIFGVNVT